MKRINKISITVAATLTLVAAAGFAQYTGMDHGGNHGMMHDMNHGPGTGAGGHGPMAGPTAMLTKQDSGSAADMGLVHGLLANHASIKRSVTRLPNGIRTLTESDDPQVAQIIKAHVASMSQRLQEGREFNIFSNTLPVLFENRDKIISKIDMTDKGAVVMQTSTDARVVAALQAHAAEVTELVREGMTAMRRGVMSRRAMSPAGSGGNRPIGDAASAADATYGVQWQGALRAVHGGDTSGKAPLQPFAGKPNLYAVGPAAGLDGEVTVLAGIFHITRVRGGEIKTDSDLSASASFLVWAEVAAWQPPMPLGVKTDNHAHLEKHIEALALKAGIDTRKPFPFRLEGTFNSVDYHVLTPPANPAAGAAHNDSAKKLP